MAGYPISSKVGTANSAVLAPPPSFFAAFGTASAVNAGAAAFGRTRRRQHMIHGMSAYEPDGCRLERFRTRPVPPTVFFVGLVCIVSIFLIFFTDRDCP